MEESIQTNLEQIREFVQEGLEHGTLVEAIYTALMSTISGDACYISTALRHASSEWYK